MTISNLITPVGPHAHLYRGPVRQLEAPPAHDSVTSSYIDADAFCWCPACGRRVSEIWHYLLHDDTPPHGLVIKAPDTTAGFRLRPCGHYVSTICWHIDPDGDPDTPARPVPPLPPTPPPFTPEIAQRPYPPSDGWPYGDRCHQPFEPAITGLSSDEVAPCHCGGDPRRPRRLYRRPQRPNPTVLGETGARWSCPLCGDGTEWFGREKRRLPGWRPWRRWVHIDCPPPRGDGVDPHWTPPTSTVMTGPVPRQVRVVYRTRTRAHPMSFPGGSFLDIDQNVDLPPDTEVVVILATDLIDGRPRRA